MTGRVALLQQENDELYGLLKGSAVGKLKEEVVALRRAVSKLEGALKGTFDNIVYWYTAEFVSSTRISCHHIKSLVRNLVCIERPAKAE